MIGAYGHRNASVAAAGRPVVARVLLAERYVSYDGTEYGRGDTMLIPEPEARWCGRWTAMPESRAAMPESRAAMPESRAARVARMSGEGGGP